MNRSCIGRNGVQSFPTTHGRNDSRYTRRLGLRARSSHASDRRRGVRPVPQPFDTRRCTTTHHLGTRQNNCRSLYCSLGSALRTLDQPLTESGRSRSAVESS